MLQQKAQQVWMWKSLGRSSQHQLSILQRTGSLSFDTCQMWQANVRVEYLHIYTNTTPRCYKIIQISLNIVT